MKTTYDDYGGIISHRRDDGTGFDCTYDDQGKIVSIRNTNGTGLDITYDNHRNQKCTFFEDNLT